MIGKGVGVCKVHVETVGAVNREGVFARGGRVLSLQVRRTPSAQVVLLFGPLCQRQWFRWLCERWPCLLNWGSDEQMTWQNDDELVFIADSLNVREPMMPC